MMKKSLSSLGESVGCMTALFAAIGYVVGGEVFAYVIHLDERYFMIMDYLDGVKSLLAGAVIGGTLGRLIARRNRRLRHEAQEHEESPAHLSKELT